MSFTANSNPIGADADHVSPFPTGIDTIDGLLRVHRRDEAQKS